jgi:large subunit ribosomal protein L6
MSRIGRLPIPIVSGVKIAIDASAVTIQGPKGSLTNVLPRGIKAEVEGTELIVHRKDDSKSQKALHGLSRSLLANAVTGVTTGFSKQLEIVGVGYRAEVSASTLKLTLGYSHPVEYKIPEGIKVAVEKKTKLNVSGFNRQQVGQVAADIRAFRPPDVYKLKGIRYAGERLRKKAGKTAVK